MSDQRTDTITQMSKEIDAIQTLIDSEWWGEECENANLHSLTGNFSIMQEFMDSRVEERDAA
jgi:hypothetical protein